jgi:hypothetical protein
VTGWLYPILRRFAPDYVIRSDELGRAMIEVARQLPEKRILESADLLELLPPKSGTST